jgi:hypothetical protein
MWLAGGAIAVLAVGWLAWRWLALPGEEELRKRQERINALKEQIRLGAGTREERQDEYVRLLLDSYAAMWQAKMITETDLRRDARTLLINEPGIRVWSRLRDSDEQVTEVFRAGRFHQIVNEEYDAIHRPVSLLGDDLVEHQRSIGARLTLTALATLLERNHNPDELREELRGFLTNPDNAAYWHRHGTDGIQMLNPATLRRLRDMAASLLH